MRCSDNNLGKPYRPRREIAIWLAPIFISLPALAEAPPARPTADQVFEQLSAAEPQQRYDALRSMPDIDLDAGDMEKFVTTLISLLDDEAPDIRAEAAKSLGRFGGSASPAIPKLIEMLDDSTPTIQVRGVWSYCSAALGQIGTDSIESLMKAIPEASDQAYTGIMGAIAEMGESAKPTVPRLVELLKDAPDQRKWSTMYGLCGIGKTSEPALPHLIENLDHSDFNVQCMACRTIAAIGDKGKPSAKKLTELMKTGNPSSSTQAAIALGAIGPVEGIDSVKLLTDMLSSQNAVVRERVMTAIGNLGLAGKDAAPLVERAMNDEEFFPQPEAAKTLWLINGDADKSVATLAKLAQSKTHDLRALEILIEMGPAALKAAPTLSELLKSEDPEVRIGAIDALSAIGPTAKPHLAAIKKLLTDEDVDVRRAVRAAIETISR